MAARIFRTPPFAAFVLLLGLLAPLPVSATTYAVGPGQQYTSISTLPALTAGDVVEIHSGTYNEARRWADSGSATSPIIIRGVGTPTPVFDGTGVSVTGSGSVPRALFQIDGDHYVIENLEFTNARNGNNGAGIRVLGDDVTVRGCKITYCDMGMMGGQDGLLVEQSEIAFNGTSLFDGYSHNFYLGGARSTIQFCYIHDAPYGQNFKTRAHYTELLYNFIADSNEGEVGPVDDAGTDTSSPESNMLMVGNVVVSKLGRTGNTSKFIDFGADNSGTGLHNGTLFLFNNTLVAGDSRITFLTASAPDAHILANNNVFYGSDRILGVSGAGVTGVNNWVPTSASVPGGFTATVSGADPGFVDGPGRDYHLSATSQCLEAGTDALDYRDGTGAAGSGAPVFHYVHPLMSETRTTVGVIDIGAYERGGGGVAPDAGVAVDGSAGSGTGGAAAVDGSAAGANATGGAGATPSAGGTGAALQDSGSAGSGAATAGAAAQSEDDSGCGCRLATSHQDGSRAWLALAAALIGLRRLRRERKWHRLPHGTARNATNSRP
jgi:hypothetical protein